MSERLTAMDIESQEFKRKMRGFDEQEVQLFLKSVADEVERLNLDNGRQREEIGELRHRIEDFERREKSLQDALIATQRLSDELVDKSREEAELLVREARITSERMLQQAQDQLVRIEDEIHRAQIERSEFERKLRGAVEQHLELLELRTRGRGNGRDAARDQEAGPEHGDNLHLLRRPSGDVG
jgi:cell division initiation protein